MRVRWCVAIGVLFIVFGACADVTSARRLVKHRAETAMAPQAFASAFSETLRFVVDIPKKFCGRMKKGKEHIDMIEKIRNFFWKPDKSPQEYGECRALREINEQLPKIRKEAADVVAAECPFDGDLSDASGARDRWTDEMRDLCRFMSEDGGEGRDASSIIHEELTRGICSEEDAGHGIQKVIADITFGLCWRVIDNLTNEREFGCPFFDEAQHYIRSALAILDNIAKKNEKSYRDLYCDYVIWSFEGARTVAFGKRPDDAHYGPEDGEYIVRISPHAFDLGLRVKDLVVAVLEEESSAPSTVLGRIVFGSTEHAITEKRHDIRRHGDIKKYLNVQKQSSVSGADEWSRSVARDLWRSWEVRLVVRTFDERGRSMDHETEPVPLGMLDAAVSVSTRFD